MLALKAANSGLHAYHPMHYGSVGEMLTDKLDLLSPNKKSERSNLEWHINVLVPWMQAHGKNGLEALWQEGTKSKSRVAADVLGARFAAAGVAGKDDAPKELPPALEDTLAAMMLDLANPEVTVDAFRTKYTSTQAHSSLDSITGYEYLAGDGSILVLVCLEPAQIRHVKTAVKAEWRVGTGMEAVLDQLKNRKTSRVPGQRVSKTKRSGGHGTATPARGPKGAVAARA